MAVDKISSKDELHEPPFSLGSRDENHVNPGPGCHLFFIILSSYQVYLTSEHGPTFFFFQGSEVSLFCKANPQDGRLLNFH